MDINLDDYFRRDSSARKIAEKLMTMRPATRQELAGDKVSITSVNRVVEVLEEAGVTIIRSTDGRQAIFQVVEIGPSKKRVRYPELDEPATIIKDELVGPAHLIEIATDNGAKWRGVLSGAFAPPPVGTAVIVMGVMRSVDRNESAILLETSKGKKLRLEAVQNVTN